MKKTIISAVVFASMFVVGAVPNAQARQCSNASLEGSYGFLDGHTLVPAGTPSAGLGRWNFDGKGNFTSTLTINDNGTVTPVNDFGPKHLEWTAAYQAVAEVRYLTWTDENQPMSDARCRTRQRDQGEGSPE
jgi:hypothetical protein